MHITEMTKTDYPMVAAKAKSADKMVMLPLLFDGSKPEVAKQHYERFNQCIKFQTKSSNIKDPIVEAIELFEHIDLIRALGDTLGQTAKSKFVDSMPTIIQTHPITCENWEKTTKKANELEHIIKKCHPPAAALPTLTQGTAVPSLYSHIAHLNHKEETDTPQPFKGAQPKQTKTSRRGKGKQPQQKPNPPPVQVQRNNTLMKILIITIMMRITEVNPEAIDLIESNILDDFSEVKILVVEANIPKTHNKVNIKVTVIKVITTKAIVVYTTTHIKAINRVIIMTNLEAEAMVKVQVITMDVVTAGHIIEAITTINTLVCISS